MIRRNIVICILLAALVIILVALNIKPKLPASMVVLRWDYNKIVSWIEKTKEVKGYDFLKPRNGGMTFLHDIACYRKYFSKKETDYEKLKKLIHYYLEQEGTPYLKNSEGLTAYDMALKYDTHIADLIKNEISLWEKDNL